MLVIALFICAVNLVVDIVYAFIDPRIKAQYKSSNKRRGKRKEAKK